MTEYCPVQNKVKFKTRDAARSARFSMWESGSIKKITDVDIYQCPYCHEFHLTHARDNSKHKKQKKIWKRVR